MHPTFVAFVPDHLAKWMYKSSILFWLTLLRRSPVAFGSPAGWGWPGCCILPGARINKWQHFRPSSSKWFGQDSLDSIYLLPNLGSGGVTRGKAMAFRLRLGSNPGMDFGYLKFRIAVSQNSLSVGPFLNRTVHTLPSSFLLPITIYQLKIFK